MVTKILSMTKAGSELEARSAVPKICRGTALSTLIVPTNRHKFVKNSISISKKSTHLEMDRMVRVIHSVGVP